MPRPTNKERIKGFFDEYLAFIKKEYSPADLEELQHLETTGYFIIDLFTTALATLILKEHTESGGSLFLNDEYLEKLLIRDNIDHKPGEYADFEFLRVNREHAGRQVDYLIRIIEKFFYKPTAEKYIAELKEDKPDLSFDKFEKELTDDYRTATLNAIKEVYSTSKKKKYPFYEKSLYKTGFSTIRQGTTTNLLSKIGLSNLSSVDEKTDRATLEKSDLVLTIDNFYNVPSLKTSTQQLLDIITVEFTETGAKTPVVQFPLSVYMEYRQLKDRKEAKNQVENDLDILTSMKISYKEKEGKNTTACTFINVASSGTIKKNGDIIFKFGDDFYNMLMRFNIMPYPSQLFRLNSKRNPNSFYFLRKISELKNMNVGKANEDIIAVKTLLESSPVMPIYEELYKKDRHAGARIIKRFSDDMDILNDTIKWYLCHSKGELLTDTEFTNLSYRDFEKLFVKIEWNNYPDQTKRLAKKAAAIEESKKKTKKKNNKK